jgi:hypothetical protein
VQGTVCKCPKKPSMPCSVCPCDQNRSTIFRLNTAVAVPWTRSLRYGVNYNSFMMIVQVKVLFPHAQNKTMSSYREISSLILFHDWFPLVTMLHHLEGNVSCKGMSMSSWLMRWEKRVIVSRESAAVESGSEAVVHNLTCGWRARLGEVLNDIERSEQSEHFTGQYVQWTLQSRTARWEYLQTCSHMTFQRLLRACTPEIHCLQVKQEENRTSRTWQTALRKENQERGVGAFTSQFLEIINQQLIWLVFRPFWQTFTVCTEGCKRRNINISSVFESNKCEKWWIDQIFTRTSTNESDIFEKRWFITVRPFNTRNSLNVDDREQCQNEWNPEHHQKEQTIISRSVHINVMQESHFLECINNRAQNSVLDVKLLSTNGKKITQNAVIINSFDSHFIQHWIYWTKGIEFRQQNDR